MTRTVVSLRNQGLFQYTLNLQFYDDQLYVLSAFTIRLSIMIVPIIITVPFGDGDQMEKSEERKAYEEKIIHRFSLEGETNGNERFYDEFNFYPFKNPNPRGQPLSAKQLYNLLHDEMDLFLPRMDNADELRKEFSRYNGGGSYKRSRNYRTQFVPPSIDHRTGEVVIKEGEEEWCKELYVIIADDPDCVWGKFFYIDELNCEGRLLRKYKNEGQDIGGICEGNAMEKHFLESPDEWWIEKEGDVNDPLALHLQLENVLASKWLGIDYSDCFMYGIESSFMEMRSMPIVIANLETGNLYFHELMPDEAHFGKHEEAAKEVEQSLKKMNEEDPSRYIARLKIDSTSDEIKL